jgi:hypothetical protein
MAAPSFDVVATFRRFKFSRSALASRWSRSAFLSATLLSPEPGLTRARRPGQRRGFLKVLP